MQQAWIHVSCQMQKGSGGSQEALTMQTATVSNAQAC